MLNGQLIAQNLLAAFQVAEANLPELQAYIKEVITYKIALNAAFGSDEQEYQCLEGEFCTNAGDIVYYGLDGLVLRESRGDDQFEVEWVDIDLPACIEIFQSETFQQWSNEYEA